MELFLFISVRLAFSPARQIQGISCGHIYLHLTWHWWITQLLESLNCFPGAAKPSGIIEALALQLIYGIWALGMGWIREGRIKFCFSFFITAIDTGVFSMYLLATWIMLASSVVIHNICAVPTLSEHPWTGYSMPISGTVSQCFFEDWSPLVCVAQKKRLYIFMLHRDYVLFSDVQIVHREACELSLFSLSRKKNPTRCVSR